jgi:ice-binding like protein
MKKVFLVIYILSMGSLAWAQSVPPLASSQTFAVLGASTVTNTGPSIITGDLGVSPGTAVTGFPPGTVTGGIMHAGDATATTAQADAHTAYAALVADPCGTNLTGKTLGTTPGAVTLSPGVYCFNSSAQLTGTLTLTGNGVFVFQMGSTLTTASNSSVVLANGATGGNVFWQVGSSATLGTNTVFAGSVLSLISDTVTTGTSVCGRVFALTGAVTLDSNAITAAGSCGSGTGGGGTGGGGGGGGQQCKDFTTGRGHITGPSGNSAEFKFKAGFKDNEDASSSPRGEVVYTDDAFECSLRMRSTSVTAYLVKGPNARRIQGTAEINGHDGTYQLDVTDDESATDSFAIRLSNGYSASGKLENGRIEIHVRCPGDKNDKDKDKDKDKDEDH